jgi:TonB family protein
MRQEQRNCPASSAWGGLENCGTTDQGQHMPNAFAAALTVLACAASTAPDMAATHPQVSATPSASPAVPARWLRGQIRPSDYPPSAVRANAGGIVYLSFVVSPDGRVRECTVQRSSGRRDLDRTTCRLIQRRFRYEPARDAQGNPVPELITGQHVWTIRPR